jgi:hypothetical protein
MSKILVAAAVLMVTRDAMTILPVTVAKHEVDAMRAVHGPENVRESDSSSVSPVEIELEGEPGMRSPEVERMEMKYGPDALAKAYGAGYEREILRVARAHEVKPATPAGTGTSGGDGDGEAPALDEMTKDQLLALAKERGVTADASMKKAEIIAALDAAAAQ